MIDSSVIFLIIKRFWISYNFIFDNLELDIGA